MDPIRILVADDEPGIRRSLQLILAARGHSVDTAENGGEALEKVRAAVAEDRPPQLLVTDIQMPGLSGLEMLETLRQEGIDLPTLVISGYGDRESVAELRRHGCRHFIDKPFNPDQVVEAVQRVLEDAGD